MIPVPGMRIRVRNQTTVVHFVENGSVLFARFYDNDIHGKPGLDYWPIGSVSLDIYFRDIDQAEKIQYPGERWKAVKARREKG